MLRFVTPRYALRYVAGVPVVVGYAVCVYDFTLDLRCSVVTRYVLIVGYVTLLIVWCRFVCYYVDCTRLRCVVWLVVVVCYVTHVYVYRFVTFILVYSR